jgi:hypothetical protein
MQEPRRTIVWVEAKIAPDRGVESQLKSYRERLRRLYGEADCFLLLVAPHQHRASFLHGSRLISTKRGDRTRPCFVSWQDVYATLTEGGRETDLRPRIRWLLQEVLAYMESEGLKLTPLKRRHVDALTHIADARTALGTVLELAATELTDAGWGCRPQFEGRGEYWEYKCGRPKGQASAGRSTKAELAWGVMPPYVFAGVYFDHAAGPALPRKADMWRAHILALNSDTDDATRWDGEVVDGTEYWVGRSLNLSHVASVGDGSREQATAIVTFVRRTFTDIEEAGRRAEHELAVDRRPNGG